MAETSLLFGVGSQEEALTSDVGVLQQIQQSYAGACNNNSEEWLAAQKEKAFSSHFDLALRQQQQIWTQQQQALHLRQQPSHQLRQQQQQKTPFQPHKHLRSPMRRVYIHSRLPQGVSSSEGQLPLQPQKPHYQLRAQQRLAVLHQQKQQQQQHDVVAAAGDPAACSAEQQHEAEDQQPSSCTGTAAHATTYAAAVPPFCAPLGFAAAASASRLPHQEPQQLALQQHLQHHLLDRQQLQHRQLQVEQQLEPHVPLQQSQVEQQLLQQQLRRLVELPSFLAAAAAEWENGATGSPPSRFPQQQRAAAAAGVPISHAAAAATTASSAAAGPAAAEQEEEAVFVASCPAFLHEQPIPVDVAAGCGASGMKVAREAAGRGGSSCSSEKNVAAAANAVEVAGGGGGAPWLLLESSLQAEGKQQPAAAVAETAEAALVRTTTGDSISFLNAAAGNNAATRSASRLSSIASAARSYCSTLSAAAAAGAAAAGTAAGGAAAAVEAGRAEAGGGEGATATTPLLQRARSREASENFAVAAAACVSSSHCSQHSLYDDRAATAEGHRLWGCSAAACVAFPRQQHLFDGGRDLPTSAAPQDVCYYQPLLASSSSLAPSSSSACLAAVPTRSRSVPQMLWGVLPGAAPAGLRAAAAAASGSLLAAAEEGRRRRSGTLCAAATFADAAVVPAAAQTPPPFPSSVDFSPLPGPAAAAAAAQDFQAKRKQDCVSLAAAAPQCLQQQQLQMVVLPAAAAAASALPARDAADSCFPARRESLALPTRWSVNERSSSSSSGYGEEVVFTAAAAAAEETEEEQKGEERWLLPLEQVPRFYPAGTFGSSIGGAAAAASPGRRGGRCQQEFRSGSRITNGFSSCFLCPSSFDGGEPLLQQPTAARAEETAGSGRDGTCSAEETGTNRQEERTARLGSGREETRDDAAEEEGGRKPALFESTVAAAAAARSLALLCMLLMSFFCNFDHGVIPAVLGEIQEHFANIGFLAQSLLGSLVYLGLLLGTVFAGVGFQYMGAKWLLVSSLTLLCAAAYCFSCASSLLLMYSMRFAMGLSQALPVVYLPVWVDEFAPEGEVTRWMAYTQLGGIGGTVVGYFLGGVLSRWQGRSLLGFASSWRTPFFIQCLALVPLILLLAVVPDRFINFRRVEPSSAQQTSDEEETVPALRGGDAEERCDDAVAAPPSSAFASYSSAAPAAAVLSPRHATGPERSAPAAGGGGRFGTGASSGGTAAAAAATAAASVAAADAIVASSSFPSSATPPSCWRVCRRTCKEVQLLLQSPLYVILTLAMSSLYFVLTGLQFWSTAYMLEVLHCSKWTVVTLSTLCFLSAPTTGVWFGGYICDLCGGYRGGSQPRTAVRVATSFAGVGCLFALGCVYCSRLLPFSLLLWGCLFCGAALVPVAVGMLLAAVPVHQRSLSSAVSQFAYNLLGWCAAPIVSGGIMDIVYFLEERKAGGAGHVLSRETPLAVGYSVILYVSVVGFLFFAIANFIRLPSEEFEKKQVELELARNRVATLSF